MSPQPSLQSGLSRRKDVTQESPLNDCLSIGTDPCDEYYKVCKGIVPVEMLPF